MCPPPRQQAWIHTIPKILSLFLSLSFSLWPACCSMEIYILLLSSLLTHMHNKPLHNFYETRAVLKWLNGPPSTSKKDSNMKVGPHFKLHRNFFCVLLFIPLQTSPFKLLHNKHALMYIEMLLTIWGVLICMSYCNYFLLPISFWWHITWCYFSDIINSLAL